MLYNNKSCYGCRAYRALDGTDSACQLGHPIDQQTKQPMESCERPLTYLALNEALADMKHGF